jgi:zinc/manganese transport system permease protein
MIGESFDLGLLLPPMAAAAIVLATHVPLGREVLTRGIIFIDLAIAQLAGLGVILAHALTAAPSPWLIQIAAFSAAISGALGLRWAERHWPQVLEAMIGTLFILAVSAALLLLANDPHGGERLQDLLAGQVLWVTYADLWLPAVVSLLVVAAWRFARPAQRPLLFYTLFAVAITTSVQLVGVYLVFASLIIPALGARRSASLKLAYLIGALGYLLGLFMSVALDLPTGPTIVWMLALTALAFGSGAMWSRRCVRRSDEQPM